MELYIDLEKALDTSRLVKKQITVKGKNGMFTRMQWIDPHTGEAVREQHTHPDDEHHHAISSMRAKHTHAMVSKYVANKRELANGVGEATGMRRAEHMSEKTLTSHLLGNIHSIPMLHLKPYMPTEEESKERKVKPAFSFPSISVTNPDLSPEKLNSLMGYDVVPKEELTKGTPILKSHTGDECLEDMHTDLDLLFKRVSKEELPYSDADSLMDYIFKGVTTDAFEKHLSKPDANMHAYLDAVTLDTENTDHDKTTVIMDFSILTSPNPNHSIGMMSRSLTRHHGDGRLEVMNDELDLRKGNANAMGRGWADHLYKKSEAIWKHLGGGHHVQVGLVANISVGVYAWARKGFDFSMGEASVQRARDELRTFCKVNGIDLDHALRNSGYSNLNELKHTWDFASLDDGHKYDLNSCAPAKYKKDISGAGHLGKAFMIGGKSHWHGAKHLNIDHITEKVSKGEV